MSVCLCASSGVPSGGAPATSSAAARIGGVKIDGEFVNYIVHYEIDDEEAEHVLTLNNFYKYN